MPDVTPSETPTPTPISGGTSPTPTPTSTSTPISGGTTTTPTPTQTRTPTKTQTNTPSNTRTQTPTRTPTKTQTNTPSNTPTNSPTRTQTKTPTNTPSNTRTPTQTRTPTKTQTNTPTKTPSNTPTNTKTPTNTPTPSITPSNTKTGTPTRTPTKTQTNTPSNTPTKTTTRTPTKTPTSTSTPISVSSTPTPTSTSGAISPTPTPTSTSTPIPVSSTPTPTRTSTPTPSFGSTQFSVMYIITDPTYEIKGAITESYNNRVYTFTTGSTEVYSLPSFSSVTSLSAIANGGGIAQSEFSSTHKKLFVGNIGDTNLHIIDVTADTISTLSITADTFGMALDTNNDLLAIINTSNGGPIDDLVVVIDAATDTVVRTIQTFDTYKGGIASDQNGYCYVVGNTNIMTKVDIINGVTADTINIGDNGTNHKVIYNTTNGYIYTLALNSRLLVWDSVDNSQQANINLSSYSGILDTQSINMVYDSNLDRIYITNKQVGGAIGLITVRCDNNTIVGFTNNLLNSTDSVYASYDTIQNRLYIGDADQLEVKVLST